MVKYLFIESRDPYRAAGTAFSRDLACTLAREGAAVVMLLVGNGVLPARRGARGEALHQLVAAGVTVCADNFSLSERGIAADRLVAGVHATPLDIVVDHLIDGSKVIWH